MRLYDYYRSSAAYRVRIALNLKGVRTEQVAVNLVDDEQSGAAYRARNPQGLVPALETGEGVLGQSLAILEYLDETHPAPALLPKRAWDRARMRSLAQTLACDVHPLNNLRVLNYLRGPLGQQQDSVERWIAHWIRHGFRALEAQAPEQGFLGGSQPMLPDVVLVPQMYSARRFGVDLGAFPRLVAIDARCAALPAFAEAAPEVVQAA